MRAIGKNNCRSSALQPLVEAAEGTVRLDQATRARTIIRVDAGAGRVDDSNGLLERDYEGLANESSGRGVWRLAKTVVEWVQDPDCSERSSGWVTEPATQYVRSVQRRAGRCLRQDGSIASGVLMCSWSTEQVCAVLGRPFAHATAPTAVLEASVNCSDQCGGGIGISFTGDTQGVGLTTSRKKRFEAQHIVTLLGSLAHNVVAWARQWLAVPQIHHVGGLRLVRDVFPLSGVLRFDDTTPLVEILLNHDALLARWLIRPLQT